MEGIQLIAQSVENMQILRLPNMSFLDILFENLSEKETTNSIR
jgi:hypothetical protein